MEFTQIALVFLYLFSVCFAAIIKNSEWIFDDDKCDTPDNKTGFCIPHKMCGSMIEFLERNKALNDREQKALKLYSCGPETSDQKVCCPTERFNLDWLGDECRTPDKSIGRCIKITTCQPMMDFLSNNGNIGSAARAALQAYVCGGANGRVTDRKVCCPSKSIALENRILESDSHMKDHSSHRNANLLPKNCGHFSSDGKIIGGDVAALYEFPWAVALKYIIDDKVQFNCGGSLISNRYILTAAHCIQPNLVGVRLGEHNFATDIDCDTYDDGEEYCAPPPQEFTISPDDIIVHPQFKSKTLEHDIALIRLGNEANTTSESVRPICLPLTVQQKQYNVRFYTVIGWGDTGDEARSKVLLKTFVKPQDNSKCAIDRSMNTRKLCAGGVNEKDACKGDSGGPLMSEYPFNGRIKNVQYGVVSYGASICGKQNKPTSYTSVPAYVEWILNNLKT